MDRRKFLTAVAASVAAPQWPITAPLSVPEVSVITNWDELKKVLGGIPASNELAACQRYYFHYYGLGCQYRAEAEL